MERDPRCLPIALVSNGGKSLSKSSIS